MEIFWNHSLIHLFTKCTDDENKENTCNQSVKDYFLDIHVCSQILITNIEINNNI